MTLLCKYRKYLDPYFGKENEGVHTYQFLKIKYFDVLVTLIAAAIFSFLFKLPYLKTLGALFVLGFILHYLFCVKTRLNVLMHKLLNIKF